MTLDAAAIDLSQAFEYGQGYVALSRVRSLEGLHLVGYNQRALEVHPQVHAQDIAFKQNSAAARKRFETMTEEEHKALSDTFVRASGGNPEGGVVRVEKKKKASTKGATFEKTLELLKDGKGIAAIAKERKLAATTITGHVEELFMQGKLDKRDIERITPRHVLEQLATIVQAFDAHGTDKLAPVYAALGGRFSFDELRLARVLV
jgi:uncharacterized protein YpbB